MRFALIWWLTELTGSATVLALASLVSMLPTVLLGPFAGALVDRWDRRWVMVISDALIAALTAVLAYLFWLGTVQVGHVYAIMFLRALGDTFQWPAMRASTSLMVPKDQLARVGGMNETLQGVVNIVSPPLGALLLEVLSIQGTLIIDLVTAALAIAPLVFIPVPRPQVDASPSEGGTILGDVAVGVRFLWGWRGLFWMLIALAALRIFTVPTFSLLPLVVTEHFRGEALQLAWMSSAHGLGFVVGGVVLSVWGGFKRQTHTVLLGLVGVGAGMIAFGFIPAEAFLLALGIMFARTAMIPMIRGPVLAIFQANVSPEMQGRVFTLLVSVVSVMAPLGLAVGGPLADALGVRTLFVLAGTGCLGIALVWALSPTIMRLEDEVGHRARVVARAAGPSEDGQP